MTEPCTRCPPFVVRCGHLGEDLAWVIDRRKCPPPHTTSGPYEVAGMGFTTACNMEGHEHISIMSANVMRFLTRAEADEEFTRREEALLGR